MTMPLKPSPPFWKKSRKTPLAYAGLIRAHLAAGDLDLAETLITTAPGALAKAKEVESTRAMLELARQAAKAGPEDELRAAVAKDPADRQALFDLALALHANGKVEEAVIDPA